jgi:cysteine-rich repeat protein
MTHKHPRRDPVFTIIVLFLMVLIISTIGYGITTGATYSMAGSNNAAYILRTTSASSQSSVSSVRRKRRVLNNSLLLRLRRAFSTRPRTRTATGVIIDDTPSSTGPAVPIKASCGDKIIISDLNETCDDGNVVSGDGCSSVCKIESGFTCYGSPSVCSSRCGDGVVVGLEKCDDGNGIAGDGCSAACKIEIGYVCKSSPSFCEPTPYCGDGVKASTEACDDGNSDHGDGCYDCAIES